MRLTRTGRFLAATLISVLAAGLMPAAALAADPDPAPVVTSVGTVAIPEGFIGDMIVASFEDSGPGPWTVSPCGSSVSCVMESPGPISLNLAWYMPLQGTTVIPVMVTDPAGGRNTAFVNLTVANETPTISAVNSNLLPDGSYVVSAQFSDPGNGPVLVTESYTCTVDLGEGAGPQTGSISGDACYLPAHFYANPGTYTVTVTVTDSLGGSASGSTVVTVVSPVPDLGPIVAGPVQVGQPWSAWASFTDEGFATETYVCGVDYGDGSYWEGPATVDHRCVAPDHFYAAPGSYHIQMYVRDSQGYWDESSTDVQSVNGAPQVASWVDPSTAVEGQVVFAHATFYDPDSTAWTCVVNYGDGTFADGIVTGNTCDGPAHQYLASGQYVGFVVITDDQGESGAWLFSVDYTNTAPSLQGGLVGDLVTGSPVYADVQISDPGWSFESYECVSVDYGDGSAPVAGTLQPGGYGMPHCVFPDHTYSMSQVYTITFTVKDGGGLTTTWATSVDIQPGNTGPVVQAPSTSTMVDEGQPADFWWGIVDPMPDVPYAIHVDWGDGTTQDFSIATPPGATVSVPHTYVYSTAHSCCNDWGAQYSATMTVTDALGKSASASQTVFVANLAPAITAPAAIHVAEGSSGTITLGSFTDPSQGPWTVRLTASTGGSLEQTFTTPGAISVEWNGDTAGSVDIEILVIDQGNAYSRATVSVVTDNAAPALDQWHYQSLALAGSNWAASVTFTDPGMTSGETYACVWNFGDGSGTQQGAISGDACAAPAHSFAYSASPYTVTVTVSDAAGGSFTDSVLVNTYRHPSVGPVSAPASAEVGTYVTASATYVPSGLSPADTCAVDYGDGSGPLAATADGSVCTGPSHRYTAAGNYTISVAVTAADGSKVTSSASINVTNPMVGAITLTGSLTEGSAVTASAPFTRVGTQTYTCKVNYGDGTSTLNGTISGTTCKGPSHAYGQPGTYTITISVTGSKGASGSSSRTATIANVAPKFTKVTIPATVKLGSALTVSATFSDPGKTETYLVRFIWGDGAVTTRTISGTTRTFSASHVYAKSAAYVVNVSITDGTLDDGNTVYYNSGVAVYDPARKVSGSGTFASPAGSCTLSSRCAGASTATFTISGTYASGATKPTAKLTLSVTGLTFTSTSVDWYVASGGIGAMYGTGTVNGVSGYRFAVDFQDGNPDNLNITILDSHGNTVYFNNGLTPLATGSITIK